jgi:hypothetical protein
MGYLLVGVFSLPGDSVGFRMAILPPARGRLDTGEYYDAD